ncbi:hypothetical protein MMC25_000826 [Agyrium rufum]|nr:hypothetical protein [Agyrium rufum]
MPGAKSITWTTENDARLFLALNKWGTIELSHEAAEKVAKYMGMQVRSLSEIKLLTAAGPGVPARAIFSHLQLAKKKIKDDGSDECDNELATQAIPLAKVNGKRGHPLTKPTSVKAGRVSKKLKTIKSGSDVEGEDHDDCDMESATGLSPGNKEGKQVTTPPETPIKPEGTKVGLSAERLRRSVSRLNYQDLHDPARQLDGAANEDGEHIFKHENTSDEDSGRSDAGKNLPSPEESDDDASI